MCQKGLLVLFAVAVWGQMAHAQRDSLPMPVADSTVVQYAYLQEWLWKPVTYSFDGIEEFNPALQQTTDWVYLGNVGSPAAPFVWQPRLRRGFDAGFHSFDIYKRSREQIRFFRGYKPYTQVSYAAGAQVDGVVTAVHAQPISSRLTLGIDYKLITHKGFYTHDNVRHLNLSNMMHLAGKQNRYHVWVYHNNNIIRHAENGGIVDDELLASENFINRKNLIPTNLSAAQTRHTSNEIGIVQQWHPTPEGNRQAATDTLPLAPLPTKRTLYIEHRVSYTANQFHYFDDAVASDSAYYGFLQTNNQGIRVWLKQRAIENAVLLRSAPEDGFGWQAGLSHTLHSVWFEGKDTLLNDVFADGSSQLNLFEDKLSLQVHGQVGLLRNFGEYLVQANAHVNTSIGKFDLHFVQQRYAPSMQQAYLRISGIELLHQTLMKPIETQLGGDLYIPKWQLKITAAGTLLTNPIYFDTLAMPTQVLGTATLAQIALVKNFTLQNWHLENTISLQRISNSAVYTMPWWWSHHRLYYQNKLFKNRLLAQFGAHIRYNAPYKADRYLPLIGQFFRQNINTIGNYPTLDLYTSGQVDQFSFFLKFENMLQPIFREANFAAPAYPLRDWYFRFGLTWTFHD